MLRICFERMFIMLCKDCQYCKGINIGKLGEKYYCRKTSVLKRLYVVPYAWDKPHKRCPLNKKVNNAQR